MRQPVGRLGAGADQVNSAAQSPCGRCIAALDNVVRLGGPGVATFDRQATRRLRNEPGPVGNDAHGMLGQMRHLAWLPDSTRVAIAIQSGTALVASLKAEDWQARRRVEAALRKLRGLRVWSRSLAAGSKTARDSDA